MEELKYKNNQTYALADCLLLLSEPWGHLKRQVIDKKITCTFLWKKHNFKQLYSFTLIDACDHMTAQVAATSVPALHFATQYNKRILEKQKRLCGRQKSVLSKFRSQTKDGWDLLVYCVHLD